MELGSGKNTSKIAVLGCGSWGTALAMQLARAGNQVCVWGNEPDVLEDIQTRSRNTKYLEDLALPVMNATVDLAQALFGAEAVLVAVPSHAFRSVLKELQAHLKPNCGLIWASKGLAENGDFLHEVVAEVLPTHKDIAMLSGPSFAKEVALNYPTAVALAASSAAFAKKTAGYFHAGVFSVYLSSDMIGLQIGGVCKNVYALSAGIIEGLGYGSNTRMAWLTRALAEMRAFGEKVGAKADTIMGLSGCGDLLLTATDNQSRNKRFGLYVGQGLNPKEAYEKVGQVVEGAQNLQQLYDKAKVYGLNLPLLNEIYAILKMNKDPRLAVQAFFARDLTPEF
ncbi:MAG: NAD(P)H-dependent glycerol-3-phosphate dehydrogenase [Gammaproteobacteria bacterium]